MWNIVSLSGFGFSIHKCINTFYKKKRAVILNRITALFRVILNNKYGSLTNPVEN